MKHFFKDFLRHTRKDLKQKTDKMNVKSGLDRVVNAAHDLDVAKGKEVNNNKIY